MDNRYLRLKRALRHHFPEQRLIDDPLLCSAYGSDASFYRLVPQLVVRINSEEEVIALLRQTRQHQTAITFRAAGTSLSGQAVSDSVLAVLEGDHWREYEVLDNGAAIRLQSGIIGAQANRYLQPYGRKIGPDPASISSCKIGGIAANNASGMCCGVDQNSYKTLQSMRLILADGTLLDTADQHSRRAFFEQHEPLLEALSQLAHRTRRNHPLAERIRHKYRIKNTTGYSLNALVDFVDPFEILQHLMIGSEGTLGFISEITYRTVIDHPCKASALIHFPDTVTACEAIPLLKQLSVDAVEMMDRAALRSIEGRKGMDESIRRLPQQATTLLIETRAETTAQLWQQIEAIEQALTPLQRLNPIRFTDQSHEFEQLWQIRKGLFPSVGAMRETGTTVVIEDVAFPVEHLAAGTAALQQLFQQHGYHNAILFGHALEGNLHFVITPDFGDRREVERYHAFMDAVCSMVVEQFDGSLKAEHSTGRNMAPYVELEWGAEAYQLMQQIKHLFDPDQLLNPGVILNSDPSIHIKNLKPMPQVDPLIDRCIECGFCEPICPSRNLSLTPRQRIVSLRQRASDPLSPAPDHYPWLLNETCAVDGLCATRCPVGINTGELVLQQRAQQLSQRGEQIAHAADRRLQTITQLTRTALGAVHQLSRVTGPKLIESASRGVRKLSGGTIPSWDRWTPRAAAQPAPASLPPGSRKGVYFSACVNQTMGAASGDRDEPRSLNQVIASLFQKAGMEMVLPAENSDDPGGHCCGLAFRSKGATETAQRRLKQLEEALWIASEAGELPVLCDASPCTARMVEGFERPIPLYDPVRFALEQLIPHLQQQQRVEQIALHIPCSARKQGLTPYFEQLAALCANQVMQPEEEGCCGFSGDKGFTTPELNQAALRRLKQQIPAGCGEGYSTSRTCEIGLSRHSEIPYRSLLYLVDRCFSAAAESANSRKTCEY
jgi:D-lactate dehydrogenase